VATGILAAALAFRLFAMLIPLVYVLVAGLGIFATAGTRAGRGGGDQLSELVVDSIAVVARTAHRGRFIALVFGGVATLVAAGGVVEVLRWVHVLAWRLAPVRQRQRPGLVLGLVAGLVLIAGASAAAEWARAAASGLGNELTVLLTSAAAQVVLLAALWLALSWALPTRRCRGPRCFPGRCCSRPGSLATTWPSRCTSRPGRPAPRRCTGRSGWRWCCWCRCSCSAGWRWPRPSSTPPCGSGALSACG
jgi:uncharacterized BrkB/YihY/UPF0761 family membrane protein